MAMIGTACISGPCEAGGITVLRANGKTIELEGRDPQVPRPAAYTFEPAAEP